MGAGGFTPITASNAVAKGPYDVIAFGRYVLFSQQNQYFK